MATIRTTSSAQSGAATALVPSPLLWYGSEFLRGIAQAWVLLGLVLYAIRTLHSAQLWSGVLCGVMVTAPLVLAVLFFYPGSKRRGRLLGGSASTPRAWGRGLVIGLGLNTLGLTCLLIFSALDSLFGRGLALAIGYSLYLIGHSFVSTYEFPLAWHYWPASSTIARIYTANTAGNVAGFGLVGVGAVMGLYLSLPLTGLLVGALCLFAVTALCRWPLIPSPGSAASTASPGLLSVPAPVVLQMPPRFLARVLLAALLLSVGFGVIPPYQAYLLTHGASASPTVIAAVSAGYYLSMMLGSAWLQWPRFAPKTVRLDWRLALLSLASGLLIFWHAVIAEAAFLCVLGGLMSQIGPEIERRLLTACPPPLQGRMSQWRGWSRLTTGVGVLGLASLALPLAHPWAWLYGGLALTWGVSALWMVREGSSSTSPAS